MELVEVDNEKLKKAEIKEKLKKISVKMGSASAAPNTLLSFFKKFCMSKTGCNNSYIINFERKGRSNQPYLLYPGNPQNPGIPVVIVDKEVFLPIESEDLGIAILSLIGTYYILDLEYPSQAKVLYAVVENIICNLKQNYSPTDNMSKTILAILS